MQPTGGAEERRGRGRVLRGLHPRLISTAPSGHWHEGGLHFLDSPLGEEPRGFSLSRLGGMWRTERSFYMAKRGAKNPVGEDQASRIEQLKHRAHQLTGGQMVPLKSDDCPPEIEEEFWKRMVAFEEADWVPPFDLLVKGGVSLPPPDELDDSQLTAKLWEVIRGL